MATRDYVTESGQLTIHWDSSLCYHAAECVKAQPGVFDPKRRPWIKTDEASDDEIAAAIDACPSGALSYTRADADAEAPAETGVTIQVMPDGPVMVVGPCEVVDDQGGVVKSGKRMALCRCGASENKPFCDGAHAAIGFSDAGLTDSHPGSDG